MTAYTPAQRDAYIAVIKRGPVHHGTARDAAGLDAATANEILAAGHAAKLITIEDHGPGAHGLVGWKS